MDRLILFARAPRLGQVKRRLAAGIGPVAALRFHRGQLGRLLLMMRRERRWRTEVALTPDRAFLRAPFAQHPQGRGDLGARMQRALSRHRRAVLVGCDIPGITREDIAAAFRALGRADVVFGPAEDGGFWLVGFSPRRPARPFHGVRWSCAETLADTLRNCAGHRVAFVRRLRDVDTAADFHALAR